MIETFPSLYKDNIEILQVNIGYKCNQTCKHCHVNAGPNRTEMMSDSLIDLIPEVIKARKIKILDLTGGAPELHPSFKRLVQEVRSLDVEVIDRCNLTILKEPGFEDLSYFLASHKVKIIASLPCYSEDNVDNQRGKGVYKKSISALKELNTFGYGMPESNLTLNLVYNPQGAFLPPSQKKLEADYKRELLERHGIHFTNLLALTNMPINRFAKYLQNTGRFFDYIYLLKKNYNSENLNAVMCKNSISVDWLGNLYDCDFNQQLGMKKDGEYRMLKDLITDKKSGKDNQIIIGEHCFGCTAGSGSSCGGALSSSV